MIPATDPRQAKTLGEAALNPDGTFNGARALSWLSHALTGGRGLSDEDVRRLFEDVKAKRAAKSPPEVR